MKKQQVIAVIMLLLVIIVGCENSSKNTTSEIGSSQSAISVVTIPQCDSIPAGVIGKDAARYDVYWGLLYVIPAHPMPGDEIYVAFETYEFDWGKIVFTRDDWSNSLEQNLVKWCDGDSRYKWYGASLGSYSGGTTIEFAIQYDPPSSYNYNHTDEIRWINNNDQNFKVFVNNGEHVIWAGDTHLRLNGTFIPADLAPVNQPLEVYTQTYPVGAATKVDLFYANNSLSWIVNATMLLESDFVGEFSQNSQWKALIPAELMNSGETINYWIRAEDSVGNIIWDSRNGQNYQVTPKSFNIAWVGGFGSYRPVDNGYSEGGFFNEDFSTSTGCWNHGASLSSYRERAVRVYVPGLTDRYFENEDHIRAASNVLKAEVYNNADIDGNWTTNSASFVKKEGNDFIYSFFSFNSLCSNYSYGDEHLGSNRYEFKVRFSSDGGENWFWRGSENGPIGGDNLILIYDADCSYFGDPFDCIPKTTGAHLSRQTEPNNLKFELDGNNSVVLTSSLENKYSEATIKNIRIKGPDADLFTLVVTNADTDEGLDLSTDYIVVKGSKLDFTVTYKPNESTPYHLPHMAEVVWNESAISSPVSEAVAIHLRGVTN